MSWSDPCARCGYHRADCDCEEGYLTCMPPMDYDEWIVQVKLEQNNYPMFKGRELDENKLKTFYWRHKTPIDTLNDLGTLT